MAISAAIFDVDGTLVNSVDLHAQAWQDAFREFDQPIEFDDLRAQIGRGGDQLMPLFLSHDEIDRIGPALQRRRGEIFRNNYLSEVRAFPGVRALFQRLARDGIAAAIASSAKPEELQDYVRIADLDGLVAATTSSGDVQRSKPYPDIFQAALDKLPGVAPRDAVVIGNSPHDARAAATAGVRAIGVLCGGFAAEDLRQAGCVALYADPEHLLARYGDWTGIAPTA